MKFASSSQGIDSGRVTILPMNRREGNLFCVSQASKPGLPGAPAESGNVPSVPECPAFPLSHGLEHVETKGVSSTLIVAL